MVFWALGVWIAAVSVRAGPAGPILWGPTVYVGGGWGRMVQDRHGRWIGVTTQYPPGTNSYLRISASTDHGRSWTTLAEVREPGRTLDNGELVVLPGGDLLLTMRSLVPGQSYRLPVYVSTDGGRTWTWRSIIDTSEGEPAQQGRGLWEPDFQLLDDGRLVVTYSNEKHPGYSQLISLRVSTDEGRTWGPEQWVVTPPRDSNLRPGMSQMTRMGNGEYLLVYEIVNLGRADVYCKTSPDGTTWSDGLGTRIPGHHCGPFVTSLSNGLVLITSCENEVSYSEDYGRTWQRIEPPAWELGFAHTWPAVYQTRSNEVAVMVVTNGVRIRFGTLQARPQWPNPWQATFEDGTDTGWTRYGGRAVVRDGRYVLENDGTSGKALTGDAFWRDGVLEADILLNTPGNAGLMFRVTNPDYEGPDHAFGYYAGLDTAGFVLLGRMSNQWTLLTNRPMPVTTGTWYRMRITMEGPEIRVYVNNLLSPRLVVRDGTFLRGQIGVRAHFCSAAFDNVTFSNAMPLRLHLKRDATAWEVSWPETATNVRLYGATRPAGPGRRIDLPVRQDGAFQRIRLPVDTAPSRFFWLQVE
jgi:hypothetical protein